MHRTLIATQKFEINTLLYHCFYLTVISLLQFQFNLSIKKNNNNNNSEHNTHFNLHRYDYLMKIRVPLYLSYNETEINCKGFICPLSYANKSGGHIIFWSPCMQPFRVWYICTLKNMYHRGSNLLTLLLIHLLSSLFLYLQLKFTFKILNTCRAFEQFSPLIFTISIIFTLTKNPR